jgi:LysM repeat protein
MSHRENAMRLVKLALAAVIVMAIVAAGFAHADVNLAGTTAAGFLSNGTGPRVLSMGGATLGLGGDLQSAAWNPAALGTMEHGQMTFAHAGLPGDMQQEWLSGGGRFGHSATRWSLQGLYQGDGSFEGRDASNNPTGTFSASSFAIGAQLAQSLGERGSVGVGAKFVNDRLGDVSGMGVTFDYGGQFRSGPFGFGASAVNVGGQMRYSGSVYEFPASYGAGVSYSMPQTGLSVALDANFPKSYYNDIRFGTEWRWKETVALRAGYRHEMAAGIDDGLSGPTFGFGAGYNGLWFDYGYLVSSLSGGSEQRLAISFHPGGFGLAGATAGSNGTGASHAPTASTTPASAPATKTAAAVPATTSATGKTASTSTKTSSPAATQTPNAHGAAATAAAVDDTKPAKTTGGPPAPASLDRAGPVATVTPTNDAPVTTPPTTRTAAPRTTSAPKTAVASAPVAAAVAAPVVASEIKSSTPASTPANAVVKTGAPAPAATEAKTTPAPAVTEAKTTPAPTATPAPAPVAAPVVAATKSATPAPTTATIPASTDPAAASSKPAVSAETATPAPAVVTTSKTVAPGKPNTSTAAATPAPVTPRPAVVTVKKGETIASIARQYGLSPAAIMMENNLVSDNVKNGQKLKLPK